MTPDWSYLLDRPENCFDAPTIGAAIQGRRILVTGAGGSIGVALSRRLRELGPAQLVLLDSHEASLWRLRQLLDAEVSPLNVRYILADVREREKLASVFRRNPTDVVFHLAAYKHVHLAEENVDEVVGVNLVGSLNLLETAADNRVGTIVFPTTDKAVDPPSVYGCTKRIIERVVRAFACAEAMPAARVARLVNVVGSQGSVVEVFARRIRDGLPVGVTDLKADRYCITMGEAVGFLLAVAAERGSGTIYLVQTGAPIAMVDLAKRLHRALRPDEPPGPRIVVTGLKPGERLHEPLTWPDEVLRPAGTPGLVRVESPAEELPAAWWLAEIRGLRAGLYDWEAADLRARLFELAGATRPGSPCCWPPGLPGEDR